MRFLSIIKDFNNNLRQLMREYLLVILCAVLLAIDTASAVIVQDNNRGVFQCPDLFGHYPDASDCSKYYVCDHGQTLEHTCNNGLVFNTELKTCDWRRNVECDTTNGNRGDHSTRNGYSDQSLAAAPESEADYPESISDVEYNKYPEYADDQAKDDPPPPPPPMPTPKPSPTPYRLPPPQRQPPPVPRRPPQTTLRPQIINARYGPRAAIEDEDDSPGVRIFDDNDEENDHKQNRFQAPNLVSNGFRPISSPISNNRLQNSHTYRPSPPSPSPTPRINHDITMQNRHTYRPSPPSPSPTPRINYDITRIPSNNDRPNSQYDNDALHEEDSNGTSPHDHSHDHNHDHEHDHHNRNHHNHNHDNHHNHENHENHDHSDYDHSPEHDPDYDYAHYDDYEEPPEDYHETHEDEGPPQNQINVPPPTPPQPTPQYKTSRPLQITISRRPSVPITRSPKPQNSNTDNNARNAHNSMPNAKRSPAVKRTGWLPNDADNAELDEFHWSMGDAESFAHEKPRIPEEAFVKLTDFKKIEKEISKYNRMPNTDNNNQVPPNDQSSDEGPPHHHQRPPQSLVGNGDYKYTYGGVDSSHYKPKRVFTLNTSNRANPKPQSRNLLRDPEDNVSRNFASGMKPTPVRMVNSHPVRPTVIKISVQSTTQKTPKKSNSATQQRNQTTVRPRSAKIRSKNNNNNTNNSNNNNNNNSTNKPPKKRPPQRNQSKPKSATRTTTKHTTSKPTFPMTTVPTPVIAKPITIPKPKLKVHINIPTRPQSPQTTREVQSQTPSKTPSTWNHAITKTQDIYDDDTRPSPPATRGAWNKQVTSGQNDKDLTKDFYLEERSQTPTKPNTSKQIVTENGDEIYDDEPEDKVIENHDAVDVEKNARSTPPQSKSFILSANKDFDETERPQLSPKPNSWTQAVTNKQEDYANDKGSSETVPNNWNNGVTKAQDVYENAKRMPNFPKPNAWNPPKPQQPVQPVIQSQALNPNTFILSVPENQNPSNEEPPKSIPKIISWNFHGVPNTPQQPRKPDVAQTTPKPNNWNQPKPRNLDSREEVRPWNVPKQTNWNQEVPKTADVVKEEKPQTSPQPKQQLPKSNEKESTRSSPKASWNKEDPIYDYYEYDKVVSPPNQNKNKNTNNNNRNNGQWQKPVAPVVSRPNSQPVPYQKAEKCFDDICIEPNCRCGGIYIPGGHSTNQVPQIVLLTFDDSVNDLNWDIYEELFSSGRKNPNGCPILGTFYVSHEWTDYGQIQTLYSRGHEMASHSITHSFGEKFSKEKWLKEIAGMRELMHLYGGVKPEDVRGMRAPFLQTGGNTMFEMLYDANFTYDSSLPVYDISPPYYPYTLDYAINHECMITPCPSNSYPGLWEVGMVMWQDLRGGRCSMADACFNPKDEQGVYDMLKNNFDRHYTSNRAPFGIFYHSRWFLTEHNRKGFVRFLDEILALGDVYLQTNHQMIEWMKNPTPLSQIKNFKPWQCSASDRPQECRRAHECKVKHKSETRSFRTCQSCPKSYPWFANNGL